MRKETFIEVTERIEKEISGYAIEVNYEVEDDLLTAIFSGLFMDSEKIEMRFFLECDSQEVHFCSISEGYISIEDTRGFWINFMSLICESKDCKER